MPAARAILSEAEAIEIFQARASESTSTELGAVYGVSETTIRDIWTARTWSCETRHLDPSRPPRHKKVGRPKGCKDVKPRKVRANHHDAFSTSTWPATRVTCRQHICHVEDALITQHIQQIPLSQQTSGRIGFSQCEESVVCVEDAGAWHRSTAEWQTSPSLCHASVNEQLHEWDAFWRFSSCTDPFCGDWEPC